MILDSSALVAIVLDEPDRTSLLVRIAEAEIVGVGAPTLVEAGIVISARIGEEGVAVLSELIARLGAVVVDFGPPHWTVAVDAWLRFGRGRHPAGLNLGDCLAYATASVASQALLANGDDFGQTDLMLA